MPSPDSNADIENEPLPEQANTKDAIEHTLSSKDHAESEIPTSPSVSDLKNEASSNTSKDHASFNPNLPEDEENEMISRLRGDAIGSTLYSERFVISTLLKLREMKEPLNNDEQFEKELESLWDMTIEEDVVLKLIELDVYEVFTQSIINYEKDFRLMEILVGIMGNMCTVSMKALDQLCEKGTTIDVLLHLIACGDSGVLLQLMRLITMVYANMESALVWNQKIMAYIEFVEHFCFILNNSNSQMLLSHALETLNATLARCATMIESKDDHDELENAEVNTNILEKLISPSLIASTMEAFQTFYIKETEENNVNNEQDDEFDNERLTTSELLKKTFIVFLNIHDIFLEQGSQAYNEDSKSSLCTCLNLIINTISTDNFVLPSSIDCLQDILECLLQIFLRNDALHNEDSVYRLILLWRILQKNIESLSSNGSKETSNEFESLDFDLNEDFKEICCLIEESLKVLLKYYNVTSLTNIFERCEADIAQKLFKLYGLDIKPYNKENIGEYCSQLKEILKV